MREHGQDDAPVPGAVAADLVVVQADLDAGAYTGLSTAFFAMRYPDAQIIATEPIKRITTC